MTKEEWETFTESGFQKCNFCGEIKESREFQKPRIIKGNIYQRGCLVCLRRKKAETDKRPDVSEYKRLQQKTRGKKWYDRNKHRSKEIYAAWKARTQERRDAERLARIAEKEPRRIARKLESKIALGMRNRIRQAVTCSGANKTSRTADLVGCSIRELKLHIERQFRHGMTWGNHTIDGWHIDHIVPCASFDLTDPDQQKRCFHYTNLQPLWAKDNLKKGSRIAGDDFKKYWPPENHALNARSET